MISMLQKLISVLFWIYFSICLLVILAIAGLLRLCTFPFDPYKKIPNKLLRVLAELMLRAPPWWEVEIEGKDKFDGSTPTVFVANHQSFLDLPMAYLLPWKMKWVAKRELFRIPFLGWLIYLTGHLSIDRSKRSAIKRLENLVEPLNDQVPVMIFPEGTRSPDGRLRRFKSGAFMLAKEYNFRVQPIVMDGGYRALPSRDWEIGMGHKLKLSVLDPVDPRDFESIDSLKKHVYQLIDKKLQRMRKSESTSRTKRQRQLESG